MFYQYATLNMHGNAVAHIHKFCTGEQGQAFIAQMHYCFETKLFETGKFRSQKSSAQYCLVFWKFDSDPLEMGELQSQGGA